MMQKETNVDCLRVTWCVTRALPNSQVDVTGVRAFLP